MQQHQVSNRIGARQRTLELEDRVVYPILGGINNAEAIMSLFIVLIASEKLLIDRFGAIEAPLPVVEVTEKTRGLGAIRMSRDKVRKLLDCSIELPRGDQLARIEDRCLLVHRGMSVDRNDIRVLCPKRARERCGQWKNRQNQGGKRASDHCGHLIETIARGRRAA
jgi:hypothetical protein